MNVDHYYKIGDSHDECQDYALTRIWDNGLAFACVADGCSSSHKRCRSVDVGARVLAMSAENVLQGLTRNVENGVGYIYDTFFHRGNQSSLGDLINLLAKSNLESMMSPEYVEYALDSTLIVTLADEKDALVFMFGDGIVSIETESGIKNREIVYGDNTPYYMAYLHDKGRNDSYKAMNNMVRIVDLDEPDRPIEMGVNALQPGERTGEYHRFTSFYAPNYKRVSIMSDGFSSFQDSDGNSINAGVTVNQSTEFKNTAGVFVQRRIKMMLKKNERQGIGHYDDLSIASIIKE